MRQYKSGSTWALWAWTDVDWQGETYLLRLHLIKTPWFSLMVHWFHGPDPAPDPHDHAYRMFTLDHSEEGASGKFASRYGCPPDWVVEHLGWLYVGPIPEDVDA